MKYIECPEKWVWQSRVFNIFLAGGIVGCPDWQSIVVDKFKDYNNIALLNPRRKHFPIDDPNAAHGQIEWEYDYLEIADAILFWFPMDTLCPIVMFELGRWSIAKKPIFVGVHPDYKRKADIEIQLSLSSPGIEIVYSLDDLVDNVKAYLKSRNIT
jgi:hypothetical protein